MKTSIISKAQKSWTTDKVSYRADVQLICVDREYAIENKSRKKEFMFFKTRPNHYFSIAYRQTDLKAKLFMYITSAA